jgi:hypothetical protein
VPRKILDDDEKPRRRSRARAAAVEAERERGLLLRIFLHSPKDMIAGLLAFAGVSAIVANALFLQSGHHPAPMFGGSAVALPMPPPVNPLPRPRPERADAAPEGRFEPRVVEPRAAEVRPADVREPRASDPLANLVKATAVAPVQVAPVMRPPAPIPAPPHSPAARRVAAVQRALTDYGYGQLKPTGTTGPDTVGAIEKFERQHKMPVTGQVSDRLVRELNAMIGHPLD